MTLSGGRCIPVYDKAGGEGKWELKQSGKKPILRPRAETRNHGITRTNTEKGPGHVRDGVQKVLGGWKRKSILPPFLTFVSKFRGYC